MSRAEFKRIVVAEQPEAPAYFVHDAILNRQERPNLEQTLAKSLRPLPLDEVLRLHNQGAQLLDVRDRYWPRPESRERVTTSGESDEQRELDCNHMGFAVSGRAFPKIIEAVRNFP